MDLHRSGEDYLETMLILEQKKGWIRSSDVAKYLKVSRASVSYAVRFLKEGGFITMDEDRLLHFTDIGRQTAAEVYERHCVLRKSLLLLGADPEGVRTVVDRIFKGYYNMNGGSPFTPAWSMADPADGEGDVCV